MECGIPVNGKKVSFILPKHLTESAIGNKKVHMYRSITQTLFLTQLTLINYLANLVHSFTLHLR